MEVDRVEDTREKKNAKSTILDKIKSIKHLDILIALVVLAVALLVYFGLFGAKNKDITVDKDSNDNFLSALEDVLSSIDGVGRTKIIVNYDDNKVIEIATKSEVTSKVDKDGSITILEETKEPIIIRNNGKDTPIILEESSGTIKGVIVVSKGANNVKVRLQLMDALSTLLNIERDKIKVYVMQ